jgi:hypothetical protein
MARWASIWYSLRHIGNSKTVITPPWLNKRRTTSPLTDSSTFLYSAQIDLKSAAPPSIVFSILKQFIPNPRVMAAWLIHSPGEPLVPLSAFPNSNAERCSSFVFLIIWSKHRLRVERLLLLLLSAARHTALSSAMLFYICWHSSELAAGEEEHSLSPITVMFSFYRCALAAST